jgi:hypothetical protein
LLRSPSAKSLCLPYGSFRRIFDCNAFFLERFSDAIGFVPILLFSCRIPARDEFLYLGQRDESFLEKPQRTWNLARPRGSPGLGLSFDPGGG